MPSHQNPLFTFVATYEVVPGHADDLESLASAYASAIAESEPRTAALGLHFDDTRTSFSHVQMLADSAAMEDHMGRIQGYLERAAEHVRIRSIAVFGEVGPRLRAALDHNAGAGAVLEVHDGPALGFSRTAPVPTGG